MEAKPLQTGSGTQKNDNGKVRMLKGVHQVKKEEGEEDKSPPWMKKLIIGMGATDHHHHDGPVIIKHEKPLLTAAQLNEFKLQVMIYKYIVAGLPLPSPLVLPIWESLLPPFNPFPFFSSQLHRTCNSSDSSCFSSFLVVVLIISRFIGFLVLLFAVVGFGTRQDSGYNNLMDPDSNRCRRTDGKRWRCKKNVITGYKYCERHMHRGRHRSRKPVESCQMITTPKATPVYVSARNSDISTTNSIPATVSNNASDAKIMGTGTHLTGGGTVVGGTARIATATMITGTVQTEAAITKAIWGSSKSGSNNNHKTNGVDDKTENGGNSANLKNLADRGISSSDITKPSSATFQKFTFSPKSVLQVQACKSTYSGRSDAELEPEPGRCRRTDGKKWRCRRDVVPHEKYCKMHMHRGAKGRREASQSPAHLNATPDISIRARLQPAAILPKVNDGNSLNTNLCMSISTNAQSAVNADVNDSAISSSSDATISGCFL